MLSLGLVALNGMRVIGRARTFAHSKTTLFMLRFSEVRARMCVMCAAMRHASSSVVFAVTSSMSTVLREYFVHLMRVVRGFGGNGLAERTGLGRLEVTTQMRTRATDSSDWCWLAGYLVL